MLPLNSLMFYPLRALRCHRLIQHWSPPSNLDTKTGWHLHGQWDDSMTLRWMKFFTAPSISCHRCIDLFLPGALITTPGLMLMAGFSNKSMKIHDRILPFLEAVCQGKKSSLRATCFWDSCSTRTAAQWPFHSFSRFT